MTPGDELVVSWNGATHLTFPQPQIAQPSARPTVEPEACMARLLAVLTFERWHSRREIQDRAGMASARVSEYLQRLVRQKRIQRQVLGTVGKQGRGQHFYRRVTR
jgi:predicted ArsR family transcriptional regulator